MSYCCLCWMVNLEASCRVIPPKSFRSALKVERILYNPLSNELDFYTLIGDPAVVTSESLEAVFVNSGNSPFDLVKESMNAADPQGIACPIV
ncbi:hypothetical protein FRX31_008599 [Thalictrum thalictroides]|uniref:Uncharacterized protein n=1 Tax=Thalictrum thalictroides TaxID=46969 RepID=A0A7J6WWK9_THATH|nr:hypothetical protein FRX31_008599 [Thalictrum thalictroides]